MCRIAPAAARGRSSRRSAACWARRTARPASCRCSRCSTPSTPQVFADIDRTKAEMLGVPISRFFDTLSTYMGSTFVNDFNILGRTYRVTAQADNPYRLSVRDVERLRTRSNSARDGAARRGREFPRRSPVLTGCRATICSRPPRCRARRCPASRPARRSARWRRSSPNLPTGFGFEWTEIALQEKVAGNTAVIAFSLAVVFVFLLLAAQYESVLLPLAVILIVPMCLLAAISGVLLARHGQQHPHADRLRGADRSRGQERHPDRRVCQAGRGAGRQLAGMPPCRPRRRGFARS